MRGRLVVEPIFAEQFDRVLRANGAVAAAEVVGGTVEVASPTNALRMLGMERDLRHGEIVVLRKGAGCDFWHRKSVSGQLVS